MINYNKIPQQMRDYTNYVGWRYEDRGEAKLAKVPYSLLTEKRASVSDPNSWANYDDAIARADRFSGIGFVLTDNDPFCFIDFDKTEDQNVLAMQQEYAVKLNSYAERSPSGQGLHVICKANVDSGSFRKKGIEVYTRSRYMTMTGDVYCDCDICPRQDIVDSLRNDLGCSNSNGSPVPGLIGSMPANRSDQEILEIASNASNGELFRALYNGDLSKHNGDHSAADMALMNILAFYTQNKEQLSRIFKNSPLGNRNKTNRIDYMNRTMDKAIRPIESFLQMHNDNLLITLPTPVKIVVQTEEEVLLDKPEGFVGDLAKLCYDASIKQIPEFAIASALGVMASICGRAYTMDDSDGLNLFIICLGKTGCGKSGIAKGMRFLMKDAKSKMIQMADFEGPSGFASGTGLLNTLKNSPTKSFCVMQDEFIARLKSFNDPKNVQGEITKTVVLELFNASEPNGQLGGMSYADIAKNIPYISRPAVSIISQGTNTEFFDIVDKQMLTSGFLPRNIILNFEGRVPLDNELWNHVAMPKQHTNALMSIATHSLKNIAQNTTTCVRCQDEVKKAHKNFKTEINSIVNRSRQSGLEDIYNRSGQNIMRIAALIAIGDNYIEPLITLKHYIWASKFVMDHINKLKVRFETSNVYFLDVQSIEIHQEDTAMKYVLNYIKATDNSIYKPGCTDQMVTDNIIPHSYLVNSMRTLSAFKQNKYNKPIKEIKDTIARLVEMGYIIEVPKSVVQAYGRNAICYRPVPSEIRDYLSQVESDPDSVE